MHTIKFTDLAFLYDLYRVLGKFRSCIKQFETIPHFDHMQNTVYYGFIFASNL